MGYACRVERDSISPKGVRLTTFVITFPRRVLAETVTHRINSDNWGDVEITFPERTTTKDISKNSASSRAIPFNKMVEAVRNDKFYPFWTKNQKGMQGEAVMDDKLIWEGNDVWDEARDNMVALATQLHYLGFHKQDCNRLLEPFAWVTQVVSSTRWDNFFALRCHEAADPHFRHIARLMYLHRRKSIPTPLERGQWHLPFVPQEEALSLRYIPPGEVDKTFVPTLIRRSVARCAWVSYNNHDQQGTDEAMDNTFTRLLASAPLHASPAEHQGTPDSLMGDTGKCGNFHGWVQLRKLFADEETEVYDPPQSELDSWGIKVEDA